MTKGASNKPNVLGRLIFGEKRKQHASPSRHRSATRNGHEVPPISSSDGTRHNKQAINIHDWAVWRMHLNEQMENGSSDPADCKQVRQFLQSNAFYQQHSRDPSTGRYNGVRLLFSIPHAKIKPESMQPVRETSVSNSNVNVKDILQSEQQHDDQSNIDDKPLTSVQTTPAKPVMTTEKTISQLLPKNLIGNTAGFIPVSEQTISTDPPRTRRSMRTSYSAADRVHSTLQKAVKDGNVLEKIKAFEMQAAAAAQADSSTPKLGRDAGVHNRIQPIVSSIPQRALSPTRSHPIQHPFSSPQLIHHDLSSASQQQLQSQQQYIRTHRSRYAHPSQQHRDGSHLRSMMGHESRKGAHVLEPAHGDIILKRRTPSQKTMNDDDYSMTIMSSMALSPSQAHHHRHHHSHYHRSSVSRSRHRQEAGHERRSSSHHDHHAHKKHHHKQKESTTNKIQAPTTTAASSSNKTSSRRGWLKGRKETSNAETTETSKQDSTTTKSNKNKKNKKNNEKDKSDSTKKATSPDPKEKSATTAENNRVYGVPNTTNNEQTKSEAISSAQPSSQFDEENDTDHEEKTTEIKKLETPLEEEEEEELEEQEKSVPLKSAEKRANQTKAYQKLSSAVEGEIPSKIEDETRFSRPTDDHAHRSDFNDDDDDDEYKSEGDVFLEEIPPQQLTSNAIERKDSVDEVSSDRRWQWSKEIGGLIEKAVHKKKQQPITILTRKNKINIEEDQQVIYEVPQADQSSSLSLKKIASFDDDKQSTSDTQISKQLLHSIMNTKKKDSTNLDRMKRDEFFEHGPHTNPEETIVNITSSA